MSAASKKPPRKLAWRIAQIVFSVALTVGIFAFAIPKLADYSAAWRAITRMTWLTLVVLVAAMVFNLVTYWWQNMASMVGLGFFQAAVNNQTTTSVADTVPGGGYLAVGVGYEMYHSWGFSNSAIALSPAVTGIWNIFMKLGVPVIALALLAITGHATASLLLALRFVGVSEHVVSWAQILGVFAFGRLITALPLTPGGLGFVELTYIGGLILAGRDHTAVSPAVFHAQVAGGVLVFRALTYGV